MNGQIRPLRTGRGTLRRTLAAVFVALLVGVTLGRALPPRAPSPAHRPPGPEKSTDGLPSALSAERIRELWDVLHEKFAGELKDEELAEGALRGIAAGTDDPYTTFADPEESRQFASDLSGSFTGVGIEIGIRRGLVTVIAPLRGSPAERAGVRAGDIIVKVDSEEINHKMTLTEVVSKIRGPAGTAVTISVAREGEEAPLDITIRRERIQIESAKWEQRDGVAVITLSAFNEDTTRIFRRVAREVLRAGVRGVLLDVRNNPGGLLSGAVDVAGHFLPPETLVVAEVPKPGAERLEHRTDGPTDLARLPLVVVMNQGSASAAEILAAALHEQRDAPLVGEKTFGKGSVQELVDLSDGSTVRVTISRWHTPKGRDLSEEGIPPSVEVKDEKPTEDPDELLDKGLELLRERLR